MTDAQIVQQYLSRDEAAIQNTSEKYGKHLYSIARNILMDAQAAEECENDTYLRAWNSIPPHEPTTYLYAFLARITRNISIDCCRRQTTKKRSAKLTTLTSELEQCIPSPSTNFPEEKTLLADTISNFLKGLPAERRIIFIRRYWYMDSVKMISKRYSISESKVKSSLFRTRNDLRSFLKKEDALR